MPLPLGAAVTQGQLPGAASLVRHSSESNEHYTPPMLVEPARATLGVIHLDPASCEEANRLVRAERYYAYADDGYLQPWRGRVFLNPPGGMSDAAQRPVRPRCGETGACGLPAPHKHEGAESSQKKWWFKLAREYAANRVEAAIFVCFSVELLQTTQVGTPPGLSIPLDWPICFPAKRVPYITAAVREAQGALPGMPASGSLGSQPPHASCVVYLGPNSARFRLAFARVGKVVGA